MSPLEKRVARLENDRSPDGLKVIIITGGLSDGVFHIATGGGSSWEGEPGESFEAFRDRVSVAALEAGARLLVIGGLPD